MTATFGRASNRVCIYTDAPKQRQFCSLLNRVVKMGGHLILIWVVRKLFVFAGLEMFCRHNSY